MMMRRARWILQGKWLLIVGVYAAAAGSAPEDRGVWAAEQKKSPPAATNVRDGAEMVLIPAGRFSMGTTDEEIDAQFADTGLPNDWKKHARDEQPRHVRTVKAFYLYKYEVTNAQYKKFIDARQHRAPPHWGGNSFPQGKQDHPVVEVSWDDAQAYCTWAGTRLPSEVQWEYAARGADAEDGKTAGRVFPWGKAWDRRLSNNASLHADKELTDAATWNTWYKAQPESSLPLTSQVGAFPKSVSPFGMHDMAGNAWEWCAGFQNPYPKLDSNGEAKSKLRARRGGSWANVALHIRSADRQGAAQDNLNIYTGFRCAKQP
ncbi:MAG: formylglycine-generating enzyme family protein [Planctomycetaceae bacterium]